MNKYMEAAVAYLGYPLMMFRRWRLHRGHKEEQGDTADKKRILILRAERIGDFVVTTPFLREVRRNYPEAYITLVVSAYSYALAKHCPYVDETLVYQKAYARHKYMSNYKAAYAFAKEHFTCPYDIAILPAFASPDAYAESWLAYYSGATRRIGYAESVSESKHRWYMGGIDLYLNHLVYTDEIRHEADRSLYLLETQGLEVKSRALELWLGAGDAERVEKLLQKDLGIPEGAKLLLLNLSTSNREKDYPTEKYIEVLEELKKIPEIPEVALLLIGAGDDARGYRDVFLAGYRGKAYDLVDRLSQTELVALMRMADYYLGGDTGPMHIAAEAGLRGVVLYKDAKTIEGILPSIVFAPWQSPLRSILPEQNIAGCEKGCHKESHCIAQIAPYRIAQEMKSIILEKDRV